MRPGRGAARVADGVDVVDAEGLGGGKQDALAVAAGRRGDAAQCAWAHVGSLGGEDVFERLACAQRRGQARVEGLRGDAGPGLGHDVVLAELALHARAVRLGRAALQRAVEPGAAAGPVEAARPRIGVAVELVAVEVGPHLHVAVLHFGRDGSHQLLEHLCALGIRGQQQLDLFVGHSDHRDPTEPVGTEDLGVDRIGRRAVQAHYDALQRSAIRGPRGRRQHDRLVAHPQGATEEGANLRVEVVAVECDQPRHGFSVGRTAAGAGAAARVPVPRSAGHLPHRAGAAG